MNNDWICGSGVVIVVLSVFVDEEDDHLLSLGKFLAIWNAVWCVSLMIIIGKRLLEAAY